jgi:hypothetical protein
VSASEDIETVASGRKRKVQFPFNSGSIFFAESMKRLYAAVLAYHRVIG